MLNQVQHDGFFYPLIFKKSSVKKRKRRKKTLDKKFFFFGIMRGVGNKFIMRR